MRLLKRAILGILALAVLLLAIGFILPSDFRVERSVVIKAPPEKIYPLIVAPAEWKRWTIWNRRDPAMQMAYSGPSSGVGAGWSWQSQSEGNGAMRFTDAVQDRKIGYQLEFPDMGMSSSGELRLEPATGGTRVTWTNAGDMGLNPINRYFGLAMDRLVGPDFQAGLANLKQLAEQ